jgi:hypothetical protein
VFSQREKVRRTGCASVISPEETVAGAGPNVDVSEVEEIPKNCSTVCCEALILDLLLPFLSTAAVARWWVIVPLTIRTGIVPSPCRIL